MRYQAFVRAAAGVLATASLATGAVFAQTTQPQPQTMIDTAPNPAQERASVGAVILMDQPVLAQREAMLAAQERSAIDTRALGAGPARLTRGAKARQDLDDQRARDAANRQKGTPQ
jgi:hypothetical protein